MGTFLYCAFMVFLMIAIIVAAVYAINFISRLGNHGPSAAEEQELIKHEYQQALDSQHCSEPWTVRYATYPCPYCGHYKVRSAKWEDKQMSVAFWGMASSTIDKHYKCEWCKKMW